MPLQVWKTGRAPVRAGADALIGTRRECEADTMDTRIPWKLAGRLILCRLIFACNKMDLTLVKLTLRPRPRAGLSLALVVFYWASAQVGVPRLWPAEPCGPCILISTNFLRLYYAHAQRFARSINVCTCHTSVDATSWAFRDS